MWFDLVVIFAVCRAVQLLFRRRTKQEEGSDGSLKLKVAKTFQAVYGGSVFQALRIPDTGHRGHQAIDAVLLTDSDLYIFSVQKLSGIVRVCSDGTWMETDMDGRPVVHPNAVTQLQEKAVVLAQYVARRGVSLPEKNFKMKVVFVNATARPEQQILLQPEVLSYEGWEDILKRGSNSTVFGLKMSPVMALKSKGNLDISYKQLQFILDTAPTWDRLELRGGGIIFGDFIRFKGKPHDVKALAVTKRSKISQYEAFHESSFWSWLGIQVNSDVRVVCTLRDYRQGIDIKPTQVEIHVKGDLEIVFHVEGATKPCTFEIKKVAILSLKA